MHDLTHGLSDREHRKELLREAKMDRRAREARASRDGRPESVRAEGGSPHPSTSGREDRSESGAERGPS